MNGFDWQIRKYMALLLRNISTPVALYNTSMEGHWQLRVKNCWQYVSNKQWKTIVSFIKPTKVCLLHSHLQLIEICQQDTEALAVAFQKWCKLKRKCKISHNRHDFYQIRFLTLYPKLANTWCSSSYITMPLTLPIFPNDIFYLLYCSIPKDIWFCSFYF